MVSTQFYRKAESNSQSFIGWDYLNKSSISHTVVAIPASIAGVTRKLL